MSDPAPDPAPVREAALREALVEELYGLGGMDEPGETLVRVEEAVAAIKSRWSIETRHDDLATVLAARPAPSGDADAEWTKAWLRAKADVLAAIDRGPVRVAVEGLLDYHGPLLRAVAPSDGAGGLDVADTERLSAVNIAFVAAYHEAAVTLRIALGSVRSLKLPDWVGAQVEAAWEETRELMDPLDLNHHSVLSPDTTP